MSRLSVWLIVEFSNPPSAAAEKKAKKEGMKQYKADQREAADERLEKRANKDSERTEARKEKEVRDSVVHESLA
jgi:hypothetical protein